MKLLSMDDYAKIAVAMGRLIQLTITGGSPDLRDDTAEIVTIFQRFCQPGNVTYCTNGGNTKQIIKHTQKILDQNDHLNLTVDISLDGLNGQLDGLRGCKGLFDNLRETYKELGVLKSHYNHRLRVGCGICVSGLNHQTAVDTAEWALANLPLDNLTPILVRGEPRNAEALNTSVEVFKTIAKMTELKLKSGKLKGYSFLPALINAKDIVQKRVIAEIYQGREKYFRCYASRAIAVIYPDGTIPGCEIREEVLGSLTETGMRFDEIWRGEKAAEFRQRIWTDKCQCYHQCYLSVNMMRSKRMMLRVMKELLV